MIFPPDAITSIIDTTGIAGTTCGTLVASSTTAQTLLYSNMITDAAANTNAILIGTSTINSVQGANRPQDIFHNIVFTNKDITCTRSLNADSLYQVVYIPRDISISSTSTEQTITGGFTSGEIMISFFAFLIFLVVAYQFFYHWITGFKIKLK